VDNKLDADKREVDLFASEMLTFVHGILIEGVHYHRLGWPMASG